MLSSQHPSKSNRFSSLGFTGSWDFSGVVVGAGLFHLVRRFLVMVATLLFISVVNLWYGISKLSVCRGLSLSSPATASRYCSLYTLRSVPFLGKKYCLSNPFVFSLVPRCHGECGSQKYTFISKAVLIFL